MTLVLVDLKSIYPNRTRSLFGLIVMKATQSQLIVFS